MNPSLASKSLTIKVVIVAAIIVVVAILGYKLYDNYQQNKIIESSTVTDVPSAPAIKQTTDLNEANTTLDETMLETSNSDDLSELDSELDAF